MPLSPRRLARTLIASLAIALAGPAIAGDWSSSEIAGRSVLTYTPERLEGRDAPLLIAVHSDLGNAQSFAETFPIYQFADRQGFRVAYVDGTAVARRNLHRTWNVGGCCGDAASEQVDDIGFLRMAIDAAVDEGLTQHSKVILFGHSNGAMMASAFACLHPEKLRGVVSVSGTLLEKECRPAEKLHVLAIHGMLDSITPLEGGRGTNHDNIEMPPVARGLEALRQAGASVELHTVETGKHSWGGMKERFQLEEGYSLTERIADFLGQKAFR